jgi:hypothetical protein
MSRVFVVCVLLLMSRSLGAQGPSDRKVIDINGGSLDLIGSPVSTADSILDRALSRAVAKVKRSATNLDPANGYPRFVRADGSWEQQSATQWTSGFFAGTLWYMYQLTRQPEWKDLAERWTVGLESNKSITSTHDLGFMIFNSFGHGYLLTGDPHYKDVVLDAGRSLVTRYNPRVGAIKSWNTERSADRRANWNTP